MTTIDIKWEDLSAGAQGALTFALEHGHVVGTSKDGILDYYEWPLWVTTQLANDGLLKQVGMGSNLATTYLMTTKGNALAYVAKRRAKAAEGSMITTVEDEYDRAQLGARKPVSPAIELERANQQIESLKQILADWKELAEKAESENERLQQELTEIQARRKRNWDAFERECKRVSLIMRAARDVYDLCFEDDRMKEVRHLRRVLKVLGARLYRSPSGEGE